MQRTALLLGALLVLAPAGAGAGEAFVVIQGLTSGEGVVQVDVFGEANAANFPYPEGGLVLEVHRPAAELLVRGAAIALGPLPPGRYALFAMHDANENGDLDRLFGIPIEDYGFSNGAAGTVGPPSFDAAAVPVAKDGPTRIPIHLAH